MNYNHQSPTSITDHWLQSPITEYNHRSPITNYTITNHWSPTTITNHRLQSPITDYNHRSSTIITDHWPQSQITNHRLQSRISYQYHRLQSPITYHRSPTTITEQRLQSPITDYNFYEYMLNFDTRYNHQINGSGYNHRIHFMNNNYSFTVAILGIWSAGCSSAIKSIAMLDWRCRSARGGYHPSIAMPFVSFSLLQPVHLEVDELNPISTLKINFQVNLCLYGTRVEEHAG